MKKDLFETAARAAHEANRAWCLLHYDATQPSWDEAPQAHKSSYLEGVRGVSRGNTSRESHESWLATKAADGWTYGPVKDADAKRHPCMVEYDDLDPQHRVKDAIFVSVVKAILTAGGAWIGASREVGP